MQKSDPRRQTRNRVLEMTQAGQSASDIARALRITRARVYVHLKVLRTSGELPVEEKAS